MERKLTEILKYIDPSSCNYQEWINVGMALKQEGYTAADWDEWSASDPNRYHAGECFVKWSTFEGSSKPVTGGTIIQMAKDRGYSFPLNENGYSLDWDSVIQKEDYVILDKGWVEGKEIQEPRIWKPAQELITYLETLFDSDEIVGYVTRSFEKDGRHMPSKGNFKKTAGQLIQELNNCHDDIGAVLGDYNPEVGAWIRFNPLDGEGVKNSNVTSFRFALVESDSMDLEQQNALIHELELPIACLVYSGKKSLHAIVRIDAKDYDEYRKRVDYLYSICKKNGLEIDQQNKNPSRLSRMPGVTRSGKKQFLMETNIGKSTWEEWKEWIESVNDDLPDPEPLENVWDSLPMLADPLIEGVLRKGHKMLIAGPSKAGKSFALIELCIAIAEGKEWLGWNCTRGKILYVNLELDRASCLHRFKDVYEALGFQPKNLNNIDIWNLRGRAVPMDKLAPKLIRRALKKDYLAVVIDPIYKVITGDENSADQMAAFCNQFDKICTELGTAVIYCHHHSKGSQGGKRSMDRASGSGVFARDPDALLDLIELEIDEKRKEQELNRSLCNGIMEWLDSINSKILDEISQDDALNQKVLMEICRKKLDKSILRELTLEIDKITKNCESKTAWRIEGTLREFPKFAPLNLWFNYPIHKTDETGMLQDIDPEMRISPKDAAIQKRKKQAESDRQKKRNEFEIEFSNIELEGKNVSAQELADRLEKTPKEVLSWFGNGQRQRKDLKKDFEKYTREDGTICIRRKACAGAQD